jgi:hypothetical protein
MHHVVGQQGLALRIHGCGERGLPRKQVDVRLDLPTVLPRHEEHEV